MLRSCDKNICYLVSFIAIALAMPPGNAQAQQVPLPKTATEVPGPPSGTAMAKAYVQTVGRVAYVWGWPLVNMTNRITAIAKVPEPGLLGGMMPVAYNGLAMLTGYIAPDERFVTCPNQDVVYATGWFDLNKEPIVFQVPNFGDRFWVYGSTMDARRNSHRSASSTAPSPASI